MSLIKTITFPTPHVLTSNLKLCKTIVRYIFLEGHIDTELTQNCLALYDYFVSASSTAGTCPPYTLRFVQCHNIVHRHTAQWLC